MVPAHFVTMTTFPKTPNQKIDRQALPAPNQVERESETTYVPPKSELEQTIVNIWQELLNVPRVGLDDNFFDLGGHSLLIVQAHQRLRQALARDLHITDMFRFPTIRALTEYLRQDSGNGEHAAHKIADRAQIRREALMRQRQQRQRIR